MYLGRMRIEIKITRLNTNEDLKLDVIQENDIN